ncbi:MAG: calcium/sodium antiporter [Candidatus Methanomethylophilus sp.]|nr:calcium/sodium antiporter [Methanomethylophilus sp.]MDD4222124.1 calcium/sodium antiporter [Methanomethylophilus sp.]MDD4668511.1 calcium/sodium antiporter [Methanomethylophilus sp.]
MEWALLGIPIGIVLLYYCADWLVDGAKALALRLGVTPFVVGLTVVAFGSAAPETVTALVSGSNPELIVGNIVGSNIANVGLAIGLAALITPIACDFRSVKFDLFCMMAFMVLMTLLSLTGTLSWPQGLVLLAALVVFIAEVFRHKRGDPNAEKEAEKEVGSPTLAAWKCLVLIAVGILGLYVGARCFIAGAVDLTGLLGVSDLLIGLLVVAVGTALPELCVCLMAAWRHENELAVSNIVGSIIFNVGFALALGILFTDVPAGGYVLTFHLPLMLLMGLLLVLMVHRHNDVSRGEGALLLLIYIAYVAAMIAFPVLTQGVL